MSCNRDFVIGRLRFVKNFTGRKPSSPPRSTAGSFRKKTKKGRGCPRHEYRAHVQVWNRLPRLHLTFLYIKNKSLENHRDVLFSWVTRIINRQNHDTIGQRSVNRSISSSPGWYDIGGGGWGEEKKRRVTRKTLESFFLLSFFRRSLVSARVKGTSHRPPHVTQFSRSRASTRPAGGFRRTRQCGLARCVNFSRNPPLPPPQTIPATATHVITFFFVTDEIEKPPFRGFLVSTHQTFAG